jgi:flagellar FliJ protein
MATKKKSHRLEPIIELAKSKEQQAAVAYGQARAELAGQQARFDELQNYRLEYIERFNKQAAQGMDATKVKDFQQFLTNLKTAIAQQSRAVDHAALRVEQQRQRWLDERRQLGVYDQLKSRYQQVEQLQEDRQEQKATDESAQRSTASNKYDD